MATKLKVGNIVQIGRKGVKREYRGLFAEVIQIYDDRNVEIRLVDNKGHYWKHPEAHGMELNAEPHLLIRRKSANR